MNNADGRGPADMGASRQCTRRLAEYAVGLRYDDIPPDVLARAKNTIADGIGAIVFGSTLPWSRMILDYAERAGANGRSRVLRPGGPLVGAASAALANGLMAHAFELDGATKPTVGVHPFATIFPAALALAQERGIGGRRVLTAFVAASECAIRIGRATKKSNEHRGFHAPGTTGPFAAAIACGRLMGLDAARMANALGIAGSLAGGLVQFSRSRSGGMVKRLHFGRANESGVLAADLADRGFTGPNDIIEGEFGFLRVFCDDYAMEEVTKDLGQTFHTLTIYMKRFPAHGTAQTPLQAIEELRAERPFTGDDVEAISIAGSRDMLERHDIPEPADIMSLQYSVNCCAALACYRDPRDPRSYDASALADPRIRALSRRVALIPLDQALQKTRDSVKVMVTLKDGTTLLRQLDHFKGTPDWPPSVADVHEKFALLMRDCAPTKAEEIFERIQNLEAETDLDWLAV
ncbi:MAG TPA: MmgE/PrpD family protein [Hyphomicrobiaceae bacterium]|nr:MmgE/PrpD family protein [Hyphomicrobiaceae bacterium]